MTKRGRTLTFQPKDKFYLKKKNGELIEKKRPLLRFLSIILLFSGLLVYYVWQQVEVNRIAIEIKKLEEQKNLLLTMNEQLKLEIDRKTNFDLIYKVAKEKLGLEFPDKSPEEILVDIPDPDKGIFKASGNYLIGKVFGADK